MQETLIQEFQDAEFNRRSAGSSKSWGECKRKRYAYGGKLAERRDDICGMFHSHTIFSTCAIASSYHSLHASHPSIGPGRSPSLKSESQILVGSRMARWLHTQLARDGPPPGPGLLGNGDMGIMGRSSALASFSLLN